MKIYIYNTKTDLLTSCSCEGKWEEREGDRVIFLPDRIQEGTIVLDKGEEGKILLQEKDLDRLVSFFGAANIRRRKILFYTPELFLKEELSLDPSGKFFLKLGDFFLCTEDGVIHELSPFDFQQSAWVKFIQTENVFVREEL